MCAGFIVFVCEYEWAYACVSNELLGAKYMGFVGEISRFSLVGEVKYEKGVLKSI